MLFRKIALSTNGKKVRKQYSMHLAFSMHSSLFFSEKERGNALKKKKPNVQNCDTANLTSEVKKSIYCYYIIWQFSDKKSQVTQDQNLTKQQKHPLTDSKEGLMLLLLCPTLLGSTLSFWPLTFNRCSNSRYCFCKFSPPLMFSH